MIVYLFMYYLFIYLFIYLLCICIYFYTATKGEESVTVTDIIGIASLAMKDRRRIKQPGQRKFNLGI